MLTSSIAKICEPWFAGIGRGVGPGTAILRGAAEVLGTAGDQSVVHKLGLGCGSH